MLCSQVGRTLGWVLPVTAPYTKTVVLGIRVLMARNVQGVTINLEFRILGRITVDNSRIRLYSVVLNCHRVSDIP